MKDRCENANHPYFDRYGGRGIAVCQRWRAYEDFRDDMRDGFRPGLTLERLDNDGDYCPTNCVWANRLVQSRNRSNTIWMTLDGEAKRLVEWAEILGIPANTLRLRRQNGWSDAEALTTPYKVRRNGR